MWRGFLLLSQASKPARWTLCSETNLARNITRGLMALKEDCCAEWEQTQLNYCRILTLNMFGVFAGGDGSRNSIISDNSESNIKVRPSTSFSWSALTFRNRHTVAMKRVGSTFISLISGIFHFYAPPCVCDGGGVCWGVPVHTAHTLLNSCRCEDFSELRSANK